MIAILLAYATAIAMAVGFALIERWRNRRRERRELATIRRRLGIRDMK